MNSAMRVPVSSFSAWCWVWSPTVLTFATSTVGCCYTDHRHAHRAIHRSHAAGPSPQVRPTETAPLGALRTVWAVRRAGVCNPRCGGFVRCHARTWWAAARARACAHPTRWQPGQCGKCPASRWAGYADCKAPCRRRRRYSPVNSIGHTRSFKKGPDQALILFDRGQIRLNTFSECLIFAQGLLAAEV
jgi:hypothetical protein